MACGRASGSASGCRAGSRAWWRSSPAREAATICCPSLHRDHTVGEVVELMQRTRATAFIWQEGYGADADKRDFIDALKAADTVQHVYRLKPLAEKDTALFPGIGPAQGRMSRRQDRSQPGRLSRLHVRHDRQAQGRDAFATIRCSPMRAQLAADWSIDRHVGGLFALAAQPQSRFRRAGDGDGDGRRARRSTTCRAARASPTASSKPTRASWSACRRTPSICCGEMQQARAERPRPAHGLPHLRLGGAERGGGAASSRRASSRKAATA